MAFHEKKTGNVFQKVINELARKDLPALLKENVVPIKKKRRSASRGSCKENGDH